MSATAILARWRDRRTAPVGWIPLRRNHLGPRRWLAAGCTAAAVAAGLQVLAPDPSSGRVPVLVATRDVPAGASLGPSDLRRVLMPRAEVPRGGAVSGADLVGRVAAVPLSPGDVVTATRLVGPQLLAGRPAGQVAAPVRLADGQAAELLRAGQRVDVLAAVEGARSARTVARDATVLAGPAVAANSEEGGLLGGAGDPAGGGLVVLAVDARTAADLAQAAAQGALSAVLR